MRVSRRRPGEVPPLAPEPTILDACTPTAAMTASVRARTSLTCQVTDVSLSRCTHVSTAFSTGPVAGGGESDNKVSDPTWSGVVHTRFPLPSWETGVYRLLLSRGFGRGGSLATRAD